MRPYKLLNQIHEYVLFFRTRSSWGCSPDSVERNNWRRLKIRGLQLQRGCHGIIDTIKEPYNITPRAPQEK